MCLGTAGVPDCYGRAGNSFTFREKDGVTLRIYTRHVTPVEERKIISNAANKNRMDRSNTSDLQQTVLAESNLQDVTTIVAQMHRNREPLLHTAVYLELCAHDLEHLKLLQTEVLTELIRSKLNVDRLILRQQQGFRCVMPSGYNLFKDQLRECFRPAVWRICIPLTIQERRILMGSILGEINLGVMYWWILTGEQMIRRMPIS